MPNPIDINPEESPHHRIAYEMRRHRMLTGWTQEQLARRVQVSSSKIGNIETVYRHADERLAQALDRVFGLDNHFHALWQDTRPHAPEHYRDFAIAERRADVVHSWDPLLIPGLFQIEPYARQIFRGAPGVTSDDVEERVQSRIRRQELLKHPACPMVISLIDEGALCRPLGDGGMMREQLGHLIKIAEHPRVTIQVVPFSAYATTGTQSAFSIAITRANAYSAYLECAPQGRTVGDRGVISTLLQYFNTIRASALSEHQSHCLIKERIDEWT